DVVSRSAGRARAGDARRPPPAPLQPRPGRRAHEDGGRGHLGADRTGPAGDDVPGARESPLRQDRRRHRRQETPGVLAGAELAARPRGHVRPRLAVLADLPEHRTGLIIVGLARCIAMVVIWNDLACGDREATAVLVAINSIFQVIAFSFLGWFYLTTLPGWLGLDTQGLDVSVGQIALNVLVFL